MSINIDTIASMDELHLARADWLALHDRWEDASAYTAYDWIVPWFRWYATGERSWIMRARDGETTVGFAPMYGWNGTFGGVPVRRIDFLGHNFGIGSFVVPGRDPRVLRAFMERLWSAREGWDLVSLKGIAYGSSVHHALTTWLGENGVEFNADVFEVPTINLEGGWSRYLATKGKNLNHQLSRARKKAAAVGEVKLERVRPRESVVVERLMDRVIAVSMRSRKTEFHGAIGSNPHVELFYRDMARGFARDGRLDLAMLSVGGHDVAYVIGLIQGRRYYHIDTAFDEGYRDTSSGTLVNLGVIRDLFDEDVDLYVNEGEDAYKSRWVTGGLACVDLQLFSPSWRASLARGSKIHVLPAMARVRERTQARVAALRARVARARDVVASHSSDED